MTLSTSVDNAPGALVLGDYLVGNADSIAGIQPQSFASTFDAHNPAVLPLNESVATLLEAARKRWAPIADGKVAFVNYDVRELPKIREHDFVYNAMGWHWAVKTGNPERIFKRVEQNMTDGAIFATYIFGLADEQCNGNPFECGELPYKESYSSGILSKVGAGS